MNRLFPLPMYTFMKIALKNGGVSFRGIKNLPPWMIKTILFEPLRWIELARYNREINQHTITTHPIFILGFYRSGTSYLHQCFSKDHRLGFHSNFQMVLPEIMLCSEKVLAPFFEFICGAFRLRDSVHRVPLSFRFPGEEDATMTTSVNPRGAQWGYFFPEKMNDYFQKYVLFQDIHASEYAAWKHEFLFLLKKISLANHSKQLVLKSPPNTARIKTLLSLFPNAKFVFIHRNPYEVYLSNQRFWQVTHKVYALGATRSADVNRIILDTYEHMMQRYLLEKELVPAGNLVEIRYDDLIQTPLATLQHIYESIQLADFNDCKNAMKSFVEGQRGFVRLNHAMAAGEKEIVTQRWEPFIRQWNYPLQ